MACIDYFTRIHFIIRKLRSLGVLLYKNSNPKDHGEYYDVSSVETHFRCRSYIQFSRDYLKPRVRHYDFDHTSYPILFDTTDFEEFVQYITPKK